MTIDEACRAVILSRGDAIVIATMGAMGALDRLDVGQPRLSCVPLMGGAAALALGIALAHPNEKVIVLDGDASLLMELGVLVTVAGSRPRNFHHFVIENGVQFAGMSNLPMASSAHQRAITPGVVAPAIAPWLMHTTGLKAVNGTPGNGP